MTATKKNSDVLPTLITLSGYVAYFNKISRKSNPYKGVLGQRGWYASWDAAKAQHKSVKRYIKELKRLGRISYRG